jgi:hypothetical protein
MKWVREASLEEAMVYHDLERTRRMLYEFALKRTRDCSAVPGKLLNPAQLQAYEALMAFAGRVDIPGQVISDHILAPGDGYTIDGTPCRSLVQELSSEDGVYHRLLEADRVDLGQSDIKALLEEVPPDWLSSDLTNSGDWLGARVAALVASLHARAGDLVEAVHLLSDTLHEPAPLLLYKPESPDIPLVRIPDAGYLRFLGRAYSDLFIALVDQGVRDGMSDGADKMTMWRNALSLKLGRTATLASFSDGGDEFWDHLRTMVPSPMDATQPETFWSGRDCGELPVGLFLEVLSDSVAHEINRDRCHDSREYHFHLVSALMERAPDSAVELVRPYLDGKQYSSFKAPDIRPDRAFGVSLWGRYYGTRDDFASVAKYLEYLHQYGYLTEELSEQASYIEGIAL